MPVQNFRASTVFALLGLALALTDCHCGKSKPLSHAGGICKSGAKGCDADKDCNDHETCQSTTGEQCCTFAARTCSDSSQCCPGQICKRDHHCFDQRIECPNGDSDCGDPGSDRVCLTYKDAQNKSDQVCGYAPCDTTHACADGLSCFKGFCVQSPPCSGHCDDGSICIPQTNSCWGYGKRCNVSCGPGYLAMEKDPRNVWDSCNNREVECECSELPPLASVDLGRYASSTALGAGQVAVSMYDGQYGDLVVRTYDATGAVVSTEYVDGVPASGTVVAGPSGPRHGIADPGDDVGQYTAITSDASGRLLVSYYDVTHKALKLAIRAAGGGTWTTQTVDRGGDVGLYTSIALDPSGKPTIAYFQRAGSASGTSCPAGDPAHPDLTTGVKLARARSANPASASDWQLSFVECAPRPAPPCYGCTSGQLCVTDSASGAVCAQSTTGCTGCTATQLCADTGAGPSCQSPYTAKPLLDTPVGVGLFPSVAFRDSTLVVAYYDGINKRLQAASSDSGLTPTTIDDGDDVGRFASVAIEPTGARRIAIAYEDATTRALKFFEATDLGRTSNPADAIIDAGLFPATGDGPSYMGANVHLHFAPDGTLFAAYQNSTGNDLRLASHSGTQWQVLQTYSKGALGFFAHVAQLPGSSKLYLSHTQLHTRLQQGHPVKDHAPRLEVFTP